ncbi:uncharacterized protein LOC141697479 [Apium graveolens]|uniref:uncharacterized protein LOC141697479 n=1 Tax=Apium graveolens TaxID=4045 RepID=UPI003D790D0C
MQATKEPEQANNYLKKNSEARIHQMISNKEQAKIEAAVETEEVQVDESNSSKKVKVGSGLEESFKERLVSLLQEYRDVFSWSPRDMPGLHESIAIHNLDVNPNRKPKLAGSLAALRRFISKLAERCLPFFDLLKGATNKKEVNWSPECQRALEEIKSYLSQPPVLIKAQPGEPLYLYLSAGAQAVGAALIREENGTQQPVYYISQILKDAETRYPRLEKFAFALVTTSRKLRHYFQGREIRVVTNQPLRKIIHKPDILGRLVNWAVELSQFNLSFIPRTAIKAQALADFIIECNFPDQDPKPMDMDQEPKKEMSSGARTLRVDGSSTSERSGAGLILKSPEGFKIQTAISFSFPATNNQAEYEALVAELKLSRTLRVQDLKIYSDSQIVVKQINGEYIVKDPTLAKYQALVQSYLASIPCHQVLQICREENEEADILSKLVRNSSDLDCSVYFEELHKPSIESGEVLEIESTQNWMTPFINYLDKGELQEDKGKAQRFKAKETKFFLEKGVLYRRTFSSPILKCIGPEEAKMQYNSSRSARNASSSGIYQG